MRIQDAWEPCSIAVKNNTCRRRHFQLPTSTMISCDRRGDIFFQRMFGGNAYQTACNNELVCRLYLHFCHSKGNDKHLEWKKTAFWLCALPSKRSHVLPRKLGHDAPRFQWLKNNSTRTAQNQPRGELGTGPDALSPVSPALAYPKDKQPNKLDSFQRVQEMQRVRFCTYFVPILTDFHKHCRLETKLLGQ